MGEGEWLSVSAQKTVEQSEGEAGAVGEGGRGGLGAGCERRDEGVRWVMYE